MENLVNIFKSLKGIQYKKNAYAVSFFLVLGCTMFFSYIVYIKLAIMCKWYVFTTIAVVLCSSFHFWITKERRPIVCSSEIPTILFIIDSSNDADRDVAEALIVKDFNRRIHGCYNRPISIDLANAYQANRFMNLNASMKDEYISNTGALVVFWGTFDSRMKSGNSVYRIHLNMSCNYVSRKTIDSQLLGIEAAKFKEPIKDLLVYKNDEIDTLEHLLQSLELISFYISSLIFRNDGLYDDAIETLKTLLEQLDYVKLNVSAINHLKSFAPVLLVDCYSLLSSKHYFAFRKTGSWDELEKMRDVLDNMRYFNDGYTYNAQMALYYFWHGRRIELVKECVQNCEQYKVKDYAARFDKVFIKMYEGYSPYRAVYAYERYRDILKHNVSEEMNFDVEEFIYDVVILEPDKVQLHWLLAMLYNSRGEYELSKCSMDVFLSAFSERFNEKLQEKVTEIKSCNASEIPFINDN